MSLLEFDRKILEWINHNRIKYLDNFFIFISNTAYLTAVLIAITILLYALFKKNTILKLKGWQILISLCASSSKIKSFAIRILSGAASKY